jgi:hypothetical protein
MQAAGLLVIILIGNGVGSDTEKEALEKLQNDLVSRDVSRREEVVKALADLKARHAAGAIPLLVQHIDYTPYAHGEVVSLITPNMRYPCYDAVQAMGLAAVQPLLDEFRRLEIDKKKRDVELVRHLIVRALVGVYEQGGQGQEMVRLRLDLEAKKHPNFAKLFRQAAPQN